jgi:tetratricopeptide (TPR) repeat protein
MAIGVLPFQTLSKLKSLAALGVVMMTLSSFADDQITKKDGTVISGQIMGASNGQIMFQSRSSTGSIVKLPYYITDIKSITMATPDAVTKVKSAAPEAVVAALEPLVAQFAGLPADWVPGAMVQLAGAYSALGQSDKSLAIYTQIGTLYPGGAYDAYVVAGKADMSLRQGKIDEALAGLQPLVTKANQDIAPSPSDGALYANVFLVYGQALEAQKKLEQALEAYLTVTTLYYQNAALAEQAGQMAKKLRDANPGLGVP